MNKKCALCGKKLYKHEPKYIIECKTKETRTMLGEKIECSVTEEKTVCGNCVSKAADFNFTVRRQE